MLCPRSSANVVAFTKVLYIYCLTFYFMKTASLWFLQDKKCVVCPKKDKTLRCLEYILYPVSSPVRRLWVWLYSHPFKTVKQVNSVL